MVDGFLHCKFAATETVRNWLVLAYWYQFDAAWVYATGYRKTWAKEAPKVLANKSPVYWLSGKYDLEAEKSWKQIDQAALQNRKMQRIHKETLDILKSLDGCSSVRVEVNVDWISLCICVLFMTFLFFLSKETNIRHVWSIYCHFQGHV